MPSVQIRPLQALTTVSLAALITYGFIALVFATTSINFLSLTFVTPVALAGLVLVIFTYRRA